MWVRFDDALGDDPRIATAGAVGAGVLLLALCYSNRNLTDGWIPEAVLQRFLTDGIGGEAERSTDEAKQRLLRSCLLSETNQNGLPGYQIEADFLLLQPTREAVLKQRTGRSLQKAAAGRLGGRASGEARRKQTRSRDEAEGKHSASIAEASAKPRYPVPGTKDKSTDAVASAPPVREHGVATHAQLCVVYTEVLKTIGPDTSIAERSGALKDALSLKNMKADPDNSDAIPNAMRAVDRVDASVGGFRTQERGGGFKRISA